MRTSVGQSGSLHAPSNDGEERFEFVLSDRSIVSTPSDRSAAWRDGLVEVLGRLEPAGAAITIVHPVPEFDEWDPRRCEKAVWRVDSASCGVHKPATEELEYRRLALEAEIEAAGPRGLDVFRLLCPGDICRTQVDGSWWWRDGAHISVEANEALIDAFVARM